MDFKTQMATLRERSDKAMELGPPAWLTRPPWLEGPLSEAEVRGSVGRVWCVSGVRVWGCGGGQVSPTIYPVSPSDRSTDRLRITHTVSIKRDHS